MPIDTRKGRDLRTARRSGAGTAGRPKLRGRAGAVVLALAAVAASVGTLSCAAIAEHQRELAQRYCGSGWPMPEGDMAYPGDPGWPFEKHLCDGVARGGTATARTMP